jgi:hypothetical protein
MAGDAPVIAWIVKDPENRGQFGDMFGAVNALFTGLALLGAMYAIRLQTEELALQREELKKSTAECSAQNEILRAQLAAAAASQRAAETKERMASLPIIRYLSGGVSPFACSAKFKNIGAHVYDVRVAADSGVQEVEGATLDVWGAGEKVSLQFKAPESGVLIVEARPL